MSEIDDLIKLLKEKNIWHELNLTKKELKQALEISMNEEAKALVTDCFRNNPRLEELHGMDKFSQDDIKIIMKYAVNRMYYWLWLKKNYDFSYQKNLKLTHLIYSDIWDDPDIDVEKQLLKDLEIGPKIGLMLISNVIKDKKKRGKK